MLKLEDVLKRTVWIGLMALSIGCSTNQTAEFKKIGETKAQEIKQKILTYGSKEGRYFGNFYPQTMDKQFRDCLAKEVSRLTNHKYVVDYSEIVIGGELMWRTQIKPFDGNGITIEDAIKIEIQPE